MKTVLSSALSRAVREELITRNVARSTELPEWHRAPVRPWTAAEARQFLAASKTDPLYPAFVLLALYGLRRGEALGLQWADIDLDRSTLHVRQQLQRVRGELSLGPVKTHAGNRESPLARSRLAMRSSCVLSSRLRTERHWVMPGPIPASSSLPGPAGPSNRATWSGRSGGSATTTRSGLSRSTTCGIPSRRYSRSCRCPPGTPRRSWVTPGSARRWRSTRAPLRTRSETHFASSTACSTTGRADGDCYRE